MPIRPTTTTDERYEFMTPKNDCFSGFRVVSIEDLLGKEALKDDRPVLVRLREQVAHRDMLKRELEKANAQIAKLEQEARELADEINRTVGKVPKK